MCVCCGVFRFSMLTIHWDDREETTGKSRMRPNCFVSSTLLFSPSLLSFSLFSISLSPLVLVMDGAPSLLFLCAVVVTKVTMGIRLGGFFLKKRRGYHHNIHTHTHTQGTGGREEALGMSPLCLFFPTTKH